jgi:DNA-binding SARP family transcriptional activator
VTLRILLLGEQAIVDDAAGAARSRSARTLALAAFLTVHAGAPQTRQRIAALFWPDSTDAQALTNLRRELHNLRHALAGEPCLTVTARDLCWHDGGAVHVDLRAFCRESDAARDAAGDDEAVLAHADAALAAYRGDLLPGVYDDWVLEARTQLQERCVQMCALVCTTRARRGDGAAALDAARLRIRLRPLEEAGYRVLMELQAGLGDRAAALATYHRCASVLERELGVEPDEATHAVLRRLLARPSTAGTATAGAVPFVGRVDEVGVLRAAWRSAAAGRPGVVLVRGSPGVGKSRLVTEVTEAARRAGAVVATAQCFATSGRLALAPVAAWLRSTDVQATLGGLDPVWRVEVDRLVPSSGGDATSRALANTWQRHRFYEGVARALLGVGRPMLLVLDNVQWCDEETLSFLTFCLGLLPRAPVLLAATLRDDGGPDDPGLADWVAHLRASGMLTDLALGPFDEKDTARLAEALRGGPLPDPERGLLAAVTGGFPLHVWRRCARWAGDRSRPGIWPPCCATGSTRPARRRRRSPGSPRRSAGTSRWTCSRWPPTWTPTGSSRRSTSCGAAGYCASTATVGRATTSPTTCCATPPTPGSARRGAGCSTDASPRASSCCTPTTSTRWPRSWRSSTPGAASPSAPSPTTVARRTWRRACSRTPRRSGCTPPRWRSSAPGRRGPTATAGSWPCWRPWRRRSTPGTATRRTPWRPSWNGRSHSPRRSAARTRSSTGWSGCGRPGSSRAGPGPRTRRRPGPSRSRHRAPRSAARRTSRSLGRQ